MGRVGLAFLETADPFLLLSAEMSRRRRQMGCQVGICPRLIRRVALARPSDVWTLDQIRCLLFWPADREVSRRRGAVRSDQLGPDPVSVGGRGSVRGDQAHSVRGPIKTVPRSAGLSPSGQDRNSLLS